MKTDRQGWNGDGVERWLHHLIVDESDSGQLHEVTEEDDAEKNVIDLGFIIGKNLDNAEQVYEVWSGEGRAFNEKHKGMQYGYARTFEGALEIMLTMNRCEHCGSLVLPFDSCPAGCVRDDDSALQIERLTADLESMKASNVRLLNMLEKVQTQIGATLQDEMQK